MASRKKKPEIPKGRLSVRKSVKLLPGVRVTGSLRGFNLVLGGGGVTYTIPLYKRGKRISLEKVPKAAIFPPPKKPEPFDEPSYAYENAFEEDKDNAELETKSVGQDLPKGTPGSPKEGGAEGPGATQEMDDEVGT